MRSPLLRRPPDVPPRLPARSLRPRPRPAGAAGPGPPAGPRPRVGHRPHPGRESVPGGDRPVRLRPRPRAGPRRRPRRRVAPAKSAPSQLLRRPDPGAAAAALRAWPGGRGAAVTAGAPLTPADVCGTITDAGGEDLLR